MSVSAPVAYAPPMPTLRRLVPALLGLGLAAPAHAADVDVLLVGNSYTSFNDLAGVLAGVLQEHPAITTARVLGHSPGGWRLPQHLAEADGTNGDTQLRRWLTEDVDGWDVVVFQDQSQVPGFYDVDPIYDQSRDAFVALDRLAAAAPGAPETVLYMTWGRRDGDPTNEALYPDFSSMEDRLEEGYRRFASAADRPVFVGPAGPAFAAVHAAVLAQGEEPTEAGSCFHRLYSGDGSHPSAEGTWLVAATLGRVLVGVEPAALADPCGAIWAAAAEVAAAEETAVGLVQADPTDDDDSVDDGAADDDDRATAPLPATTTGCGCGSGGRSGSAWALLLLGLSLRSRGSRAARSRAR